MNTTKKTSSQTTAFNWDRSLNKIFKASQEWMMASGLNRFEESIQSVKEDLSSSERLDLGVNIRLWMAGDTLGVETCVLSKKQYVKQLAHTLWWSMDFQGLAFRVLALAGKLRGKQLVLPFANSMKVAGIVMLSRWDEAKNYAQLLIEVAHSDQAMKPDIWRKDSWGNGTHTAFLIFLMARGFDISTHYESVAPLLPAYKRLLDVWRTTDEATYREAMRLAAEFHISRSKNSTDRTEYEFDNYLDRVYPAELLAVQALRRRDGLPEFQTGHLLVDTPWSIIRDAEPVEPHPVFIAIQDRMRRDYPGFV